MPGPVTLVVEGPTDAVVARRLLLEAGLEPGPAYVQHGRVELDRKLTGYNSAARFSCWLVLRDLDKDGHCAPALRHRLLPRPAAHMRLHIAVRALEAWLLADRDAIARFLAVAVSRVPPDPDAIPDPKGAVVDLARQSRSKAMREAIVPAPGTTARVGPGYGAVVLEFANTHWRPAVAAGHRHSLARLRDFLRAVPRKEGRG